MRRAASLHIDVYSDECMRGRAADEEEAEAEPEPEADAGRRCKEVVDAALRKVFEGDAAVDGRASVVVVVERAENCCAAHTSKSASEELVPAEVAAGATKEDEGIVRVAPAEEGRVCKAEVEAECAYLD